VTARHEKSHKDRQLKKEKRQQLQLQQRASVAPAADGETDSANEHPGRAARRRPPVVYTEPSVSSKLRKGDPFTYADDHNVIVVYRNKTE